METDVNIECMWIFDIFISYEPLAIIYFYILFNEFNILLDITIPKSFLVIK